MISHNLQFVQQIKKATTPYDESQIYDAHGKGDKVIRSFKNGMLIVEEEDGKQFPPNGPTAFCPNNVAPDETRCFENRKLPILFISVVKLHVIVTIPK